MNRAKHPYRTLAVLAFTTLFGCSNATPASPTLSEVVINLYSTETAYPLIDTLAQSYQQHYSRFRIEIPIGSQEDLLQQLQDGSIDYFVTYEQPIDTRLWVAPLAQDGLAMVVHPQNPIRNLSLEQVRDIYSGFTHHWQEVGGEDAPITIYSHEEGSDYRQLFTQLVLGQRVTSANARILPSHEAMLAEISQNPYGIGYLPWSMIRDGVLPLALDGIAPSQATLTANTYPLRHTVYIIGRVEPQTDYRSFLAWVQSSAGQATLAERYIPLPR